MVYFVVPFWSPRWAVVRGHSFICYLIFKIVCMKAFAITVLVALVIVIRCSLLSIKLYGILSSLMARNCLPFPKIG